MTGVKPIAKRLLCRILPNRYFVTRPISSWPASLGLVHDIRVPRGVLPNAIPSPLGCANINIILELVERTAAIPGDLAECGVFRGATLVPTAIYLQQRGVNKHILGFDSFQGFDNTVVKDVTLGGTWDDPDRRIGGFSETSETVVANKLRVFGVQRGVTLVPGYFRDTLASYGQARFSFVHLDCDTYSSYSECLSFFYPRVNTGGIILFDEYNDPAWPGCNIAIDEFLLNKPEKPQLIIRDNYQKFYIQKLI